MTATNTAPTVWSGGSVMLSHEVSCPEPGYSGSELELMQAMNEYKRTSGRMFPTWSEVLEVIRGLGYEKPVRR
jgi:hypothetical protein